MPTYEYRYNQHVFRFFQRRLLTMTCCPAGEKNAAVHYSTGLMRVRVTCVTRTNYDAEQ